MNERTQVISNTEWPLAPRSSMSPLRHNAPSSLTNQPPVHKSMTHPARSRDQMT